MAKWLQEELSVTQHPQKTNITHWDKRLRFLGYDLRGQRNLNGTRWLRLSIPPEKERTLKAKVKHLCGYTQIPELDLVMNVNAQMRGWTQYYRYANNAQRHFAYLTGVVYWLGAHYLGRKHRCSIKRVMRLHYGTDPTSGRRALYIRNSKGEQVFLWEQTAAATNRLQQDGWCPRQPAASDDRLEQRPQHCAKADSVIDKASRVRCMWTKQRHC